MKRDVQEAACTEVMLFSMRDGTETKIADS